MKHKATIKTSKQETRGRPRSPIDPKERTSKHVISLVAVDEWATEIDAQLTAALAAGDSEKILDAGNSRIYVLAVAALRARLEGLTHFEKLSELDRMHTDARRLILDAIA